MNYVTLYRKYRSKDFDQLVGQSSIITILNNAIKHDRVAHAYLFCGPRGTGKTSTARIFSKMLNCEQGKTCKPCGVCDICLGIDESRLVDVLEIDAASNTSVEHIREIRDRVNFLPAMARYKVYIIDEVHMLSQSAFNALLKTLEEPPSQVVFILATTDPQKIPATVLSRCQRLDFSVIDHAQICDHLASISKSESVALSPEAAGFIAKKSSGCMRDAVSLLDQAIAFCEGDISLENLQTMLGVSSSQNMIEIMTAIIDRNVLSLFELLELQFARGVNPYTLILELINFLRSTLMQLEGVVSLGFTSEDEQKLQKKLGKKLGRDRLLGMLKELSHFLNELRFSTEARMLAEVFLLGLMQEPQTQQPRAVAVEANAKTPTPSPVQQRSPAPITKQETAVAPEPVAENLMDIKHHWSEVLSQVKTKKMTLYALFSEAKLDTFEGDKNLTLSFKQGFNYHCERLNKDENKSLIETVISSVLGKEIKVSFVMQARAGGDENQKQQADNKKKKVDSVASFFDGQIL
jgi:DNA polymerase III subunit gamma/tau